MALIQHVIQDLRIRRDEELATPMGSALEELLGGGSPQILPDRFTEAGCREAILSDDPTSHTQRNEMV
jgi:hypothetical protein